MSHTIEEWRSKGVEREGCVDNSQARRPVPGASLRGPRFGFLTAVDADVSAELDDSDTSFGAEAADEAGGGAEAFGGLVDGE